MRSSSASPARARVLLGASLALLVFAAGLAGCASDGPSRSDRRRMESLQRPLAGSATLLDSALTVDARLGPFHARPPRPEGDEDSRAARGEPRRRSGGGGGFNASAGGAGGGMSLGGGGGGGGRPPGGGERGEGGPRGSDEFGGDAHFGGPRERGRGGMLGFPRQTLQLTLTNRGTQTLALELTELRSALGNFAPRPERLELAPGASTALDPVSGDAGGALDSLDVVLSLRRGTETFSQTVHLVATGEPAPPPPTRE